jgi:hypothetical protein
VGDVIECSRDILVLEAGWVFVLCSFLSLGYG